MNATIEKKKNKIYYREIRYTDKKNHNLKSKSHEILKWCHIQTRANIQQETRIKLYYFLQELILIK